MVCKWLQTKYITIEIYFNKKIKFNKYFNLSLQILFLEYNKSMLCECYEWSEINENRLYKLYY